MCYTFLHSIRIIMENFELIKALVWILIVAGHFLTLVGFFVIFHIFRPQKSPADESNRINKIRLVWFALTREELFVNSMPWLKNDEYDNVKHHNPQ